jgi:hypothetical protein
MAVTFYSFPGNLVSSIGDQKTGRMKKMAHNKYFMTDESFESFAEKYPNVKRSDVEDLFAQELLNSTVNRVQRSEIESLKSKALGVMGTDQEMKFSDIESGMLMASLSDGRQALKEIMENIPVEAPTCTDGTKMKDQGSKKKAS